MENTPCSLPPLSTDGDRPTPPVAIGIVPAGAATGCAVWELDAQQYRSISEGTAIHALAVVERARRAGPVLIVIGTRGGAAGPDVRLWDAWLAAVGLPYRLAAASPAPWDAARQVVARGWLGALPPHGVEAAALVGGVSRRHVALWGAAS